MQGYQHMLSKRRKKPDRQDSETQDRTGAHPEVSFGRPTFPSETKSETNIQPPRNNTAPAQRSSSSSYPSSSSGSYSSTPQTSARPVSDQYSQQVYQSSTIPTDRPGSLGGYEAPSNAYHPGTSRPQPFDGSNDDYRQVPGSEVNAAWNASQDLSGRRDFTIPKNRNRPTDLGVYGVQQRLQGRRKDTRDNQLVDDRRPMRMPKERQQDNPTWHAPSNFPDQGVADLDWDFPRDVQTAAPQRRSIPQIISPRSSGRYTSEPEQITDDGREEWHDEDPRNSMYGEPRDEDYHEDFAEHSRSRVSAANHSIPGQRTSVASYNVDAPRFTNDEGMDQYRRRDDDRADPPSLSRRRTEADWTYAGQGSNVAGMPGSALRRSIGFEHEYEDSEDQDSRRPYTRYEGSVSSSHTSAFEWEVYVWWDNPDPNRQSFVIESHTLLFDSGCQGSNWVAEKVVRRLGARTRQLSHTANFVGFNGQPMTSGYSTTLVFQNKRGGPDRRAVFLVAPGDGLPYDLVLGAEDSLKFGILKPAAVLGLAAPRQSREERKQQEERDALQAQRRKDQKDKQKQLTRKKVSSAEQSQYAESSRGKPPR